MFVLLAHAAQNLGVGLRRLLKLDLYYPFVCGGDTGGAAGGKARSTEAQSNTHE